MISAISFSASFFFPRLAKASISVQGKRSICTKISGKYIMSYKSLGQFINLSTNSCY